MKDTWDKAHVVLSAVGALFVAGGLLFTGCQIRNARLALQATTQYNVEKDYSNPKNQPVRWLAEGRDPSATIDADNSGLGNDGDNEITGAYVSDGNTGVGGVLGTEAPDLGDGAWRWFYTQQHGDNFTWEVRLKENENEQ